MPTLQTPEGRVEYSEVGAGEPIILVHSAPGTVAQWRLLSNVLQDAYQLLAVNLRGVGASEPWHGRRRLTVDDDASVVRRLMNGRDAAVHLVGHSYGGAVCLRVALATPGQQIRTMTLIEPMVYPLLRAAGHDGLFAEAVDPVEAFRTAQTAPAIESAWQKATDRYHGAGAWTALPELVRTTLLARTPIVVERCHALLSNSTSAADLRSLAVNTLVLCGERTCEPERRLSEIVSSLIQGSAFQMIKAAGHMSPLTHPIEVATAIRAHAAGRSAELSDRAGLERPTRNPDDTSQARV